MASKLARCVDRLWTETRLQISLQDLMVVLRHLIGTPHRKALLPQIDKLFNERILLGSGVGSQETLRYGMDFGVHLRY